MGEIGDLDVPVTLLEIAAARGPGLVGLVVVAAAVGEAVPVLGSQVEVVRVSGGSHAATAEPRLQEVPVLAHGVVLVI